jgi:hypothetical protein
LGTRKSIEHEKKCIGWCHNDVDIVIFHDLVNAFLAALFTPNSKISLCSVLVMLFATIQDISDHVLSGLASFVERRDDELKCIELGVGR